MYLVYIDESRRNCENRIVLGGLVIKDEFVKNVNNIFADVILNEISSAIDRHTIGSDNLEDVETWIKDRRSLNDLIIHMKEFINEKDTLRKLLKKIGVTHEQIIEIKRHILFDIVEKLGKMKREEVFAVAARVEKHLTLDLKYKLAFKFILERIAMSVKYGEPILVVFDTPGKDFKANEIYETYRKWLNEGVIDDGDKSPSFSDLRMKYFDEILMSREGDRIHRGLQVTDVIAWTIGRMDDIDIRNNTSPCVLRRASKKDS